MELGQKLKDARTRAGLKQEELAKAIGVSRQTVSNWENNRSYPDIASVLRLSDLYGITLDEMLKEDQNLRAHFEDRAAKKKRFWQLALEYGLVMEIVGILLAGQDFTGAGYGLQILGSVVVWISLWMHIRLFDHTKEEITRFCVGFGILMAGMAVELLFPGFSEEPSLLLAAFYFLRAAGSGLVLFSNVWSQFWKSPRFFLILAFLVGMPLFNVMSHFQSAGSLNQATPFSGDYRIARVLYPEDREPDPAVRIDLTEMLSGQSLRIYKNGDDYEILGYFTYQQPSAHQQEQGIWLLTSEENPQTLYRLAVEADGGVTLSCSENQQLQWRWLLRREYSCGLMSATFGHTMTTSPGWYLPEEPDPEPYFRKTEDVVGKADITITLPGWGSESLTLQEEYHHADQVEYREYTLENKKAGVFELELETHYDGREEYALYRIDHAGGQFRFILTFAQGPQDAFYDLWAEK